MKIVITGTSTGIGRSLAEHLLGHGHEILGLARSYQTAFEQQHSGHFRAARCDVGCWPDINKVAAELNWPNLDALIACAGVQGEIGPAVEVDPAKWSETVRTNLDGTYFTIRAFYPALSRNPNRTKIICFSGGGATKSRPNFSAYGVAKAGVVRLVETIADELSGLPVDINAVAPGAINTRLTDEVIAKGPAVSGKTEYEAALKQKASGGSPISKVLDLIDWMLSPRSDGLTGRLLSAPWDPWAQLDAKKISMLSKTDVFTLRRIVAAERGLKLE